MVTEVTSTEIASTEATVKAIVQPRTAIQWNLAETAQFSIRQKSYAQAQVTK